MEDISLEEVSYRIFFSSLLVKNALGALDPHLLADLSEASFDGHEGKKVDRYLLTHSRWYLAVIFTIITLHLLLTFVEPFSPAQYAAPLLPLAVIQMLGFFFSAVYLFDIVIRGSYMSGSEFLQPWNMIRLTLVCMGLLEGLCYILLLLFSLKPFLFWAYLRAFRPLLLIERSSTLRHIVETSLRSSLASLPIFGIMASILLLYSYIGFIVFATTTEGQRYFNSLPNSLTSMFILLTTANFPDIMMPIYSRARLSAIFFISYLLIMMFFLVHLVTATYYNKFREYTAHNSDLELHLRRDCLDQAFHLLDYHGVSSLSYSQWCELLYALDEGYSEDTMGLLFHLVDRDNSGSISRSEFREVCNFLDLDFTSEEVSIPQADPDMPTAPPAAVTSPSWRSRICQALFSQAFAVRVQQAFLILACLLLIFETAGCSPVLEVEPDAAWHCEIWAGVALMVSCLFVVEQGLMMFMLRHRFFRSRWRLVDLLLCAMMFVAQILCTSIDWIYSSTSRLLLIPRIFIILRLFINFRLTRIVIRALYRIIGPLLRYLLVLACLYFIYAVFGVCLFQDTILPEDPRILASAYAANNYWANNFNTLASAFVVLLEIMTINNFFVIMDAYVTVTSIWARLYFISFIILTVYIYLNMFTGFILESFLRSYEAISSKATFEQNLQLRIDEAGRRMQARDPSDESSTTTLRWSAHFQPKLLDLYLDMFHSQTTHIPDDLISINQSKAQL